VLTPGGSYADNPEPWTLQPDQLAGMLTIERVESDGAAQYQVGLSAPKLGAYLAGLATQVAAGPQNARFVFNDETAQLEVVQAAVIGRQLQVQSSIDHINQQLAQGAHQIDLKYEFTNPEITDNAVAADLGITQLVAEQTTYFYGSSVARMQNITTAATRFHGLLVAPGAVFSMVDNIGDISLESGFAEALIIFGDRTIKGVGGGVCQVSTTLFRTVFFGGYPIIERYPHAYRVSYYEYNAAVQRDPQLVGLDATVYAPVVDFKFQNDTPYWLLMETYVNEAARTITWKFYSTSDGRRVEWESTGPTDIVEAPDPIYEENEELGKGEVKQVDYAAEGATVRVTRWVYRGDELLYEDHINTKYQAWPDIFQYGKGTPGMPPKQVQGQNQNN
jgi:vancomycin resistance protein YoaR